MSRTNFKVSARSDYYDKVLQPIECNPMFRVVNERSGSRLCFGNYVCCELLGGVVEFYPNGALVVREVPFKSHTHALMSSYSFYNNFGEKVFGVSNHKYAMVDGQRCLLEPEEKIGIEVRGGCVIITKSPILGKGEVSKIAFDVTTGEKFNPDEEQQISMFD